MINLNSIHYIFLYADVLQMAPNNLLYLNNYYLLH